MATKGKIKKAYTSFLSSDNGKYLGNTSIDYCFEEYLLNVFKFREKYIKEYKWFLLLSKNFKKQEGVISAGDIIYETFVHKVSIDFDFAEKLKLFDFVSAQCFIADDKLTDAMLELCAYSSLVFIVSRRSYLTTDEIRIDFEVCHQDCENECLKSLITQTIKE